MASVDQFCLHVLGGERIDHGFTGCDDALALVELAHAVNFFVLELDFLDSGHRFDFDETNQTFLAADDEMAWVQVFDVGDSFGDNPFARSYSDLFVLVMGEVL